MGLTGALGTLGVMTNNNHAKICVMARAKLDREAYRALVAAVCGLSVELECDFSPIALWSVLRSRPTVMLVVADSFTPELRDLLPMIRRFTPNAWIIILANGADPSAVQSWGAAELDSLMAREAEPDDLRRTIEAALRREETYSPGVKQLLAQGRKSQEGQARLSRRERELLPLLARGMTLREAAGKMTVSYKTADSYRTSMLRKLGIRDRVELARYAIREGIIVA